MFICRPESTFSRYVSAVTILFWNGSPRGIVFRLFIENGGN